MTEIKREWLSVAQISKHVGLCERFIRSAIASGDLRAKRFSRRAVRVHRDDLADWLRTREAAAR